MGPSAQQINLTHSPGKCNLLHLCKALRFDMIGISIIAAYPLKRETADSQDTDEALLNLAMFIFGIGSHGYPMTTINL